MDLPFGSIESLTRAYLAREVSPAEIVHFYLDRIDRYDPVLCANITVAADKARAASEKAERDIIAGNSVGPLHGIPIAVKDTEATASIRTTHGSHAFKDYVPDHDSIVAARLKAAGAILIAKTNVPELGMGSESESPAGGYSRNPWDPSKTSGGSSGGSAAAVASGFAATATGSDAAGSTITPAAFCGVFGMKPTRGRIPHWPPPNTWSSFLEAGPITRYVEDAALLLSVLAGSDPRDRFSQKFPDSAIGTSFDSTPLGLKAAWTTNMGYGKTGEEAAAAGLKFVQTLSEMGLYIEETHPAISSPFEIWTTIARVEEFAAWNVLLATQPEKLSRAMRERLQIGQAIDPGDYAAALNERKEFQSAFSRFFEKFDFLIAPTNSFGAFPPGNPPGEIEGTLVRPDWEGFTPFPICANLSGYPAATLPSGFTASGMPLGLMIIAKPEAEALLLSVCAALEEVHPWPRIAPLERTLAKGSPYVSHQRS